MTSILLGVLFAALTAMCAWTVTDCLARAFRRDTEGWEAVACFVFAALFLAAALLSAVLSLGFLFGESR